MSARHGGDVRGYRLRHGRPPLDFSASLNPLGMPPSVREAALRAVDDAEPYPDPHCRELTVALAERLGLAPERLFCGNGAVDVLYRFVHALRPRNALVAAPTFCEYERALETAGCRVQRHLPRPGDGFVLRDDILSKIVAGVDVLFLCQPNNPTSRLADPELMRAILEHATEAGTVLFVDECFRHFVDEPERHSLLGFVHSHPNLFILDSFTKLYAMAGLRLGFGIAGDARLVAGLRDAGPPWPVSSVAQAAGLAALSETDFVERSRRTLREAKGPLAAGLAALGLEVIGKDANFVFFRSGRTDLDAGLERAGIMLRNCGGFYGLGPGFYRAAVRLEEENRRLLRALATLLDKDP